MTAAPTILALDSAAAACSVALWRDGALAAHRFRPMARGHAEALMPMLAETMAAADAAFADLDLVAVTVGPGAFTGLRIGLAVARGIGLAAGVPVRGVTTLAAVAEAVPAAERRGRALLVVLDTKRAELYAQSFDGDLAPLGEPAAVSPAALAGLLPAGPLLVAGDAAERLRPWLAGRPDAAAWSAAPGGPDAAAVARLAARTLAAGDGRGLPPTPLYLQAPAVTLPGRGR